MDSPKSLYPSSSSKLGALNMLDRRTPEMAALQVHLMSLQAQVNKNTSFIAFRRKFILKMLTVSNIASYAFGYR